MSKRILTEEQKEAARVRARAWGEANKLKSPEELAAWRERRREQNQKDRAAIKADPEKQAAFLARQRERQRARYAADPAKVKAWNDASVARRKDEVAAYKKGWNKQNAERIAARKAELYKANIEGNRQDHRERYRKDAERRKEKAREYQKRNREKVLAMARARYRVNKRNRLAKNKEWAKKNPDKVRANARRGQKNYRRRHPEKVSALAAIRRARKRGATIGDVKEIKAYYHHVRTAEKISCHYCGKDIPKGKRTVDHVKPLSKGGPHAVNNFVPACWFCNGSKHDKLPEEFASQRAGQ